MNDEHKDHNKVLASPPASHLGEIHWHILRASTFMHSRTTVKKPAGPTGKFLQYEQTGFGEEIGRDEINWWVFKKEANLDELREQTERALAAKDFAPLPSIVPALACTNCARCPYFAPF